MFSLDEFYLYLKIIIYIYIYIYCGVEKFGNSSPFHIKSKAHAEEE